MRMRRLSSLAVLSVLASSLVALPVSAEAAGGLVTISSSSLRVSVDNGFPRVASYADSRTGAVLYGNEDKLSQVVLNGTAYTPEVTSHKSRDRVDYVLRFPGYGGV